MRLGFRIAVVLVALPLGAARGGEITADGERLAKALDSMNVEQLWLARQIVSWKTGQPLNKPVTDNKGHTHCSAFVAAACLKQDVYILRPPEHSTVLLANAQYDWLKAEGKEKGWKPVKSAIEAQQLANRGALVVAAFKEADAKKPGHVALVRPSTKSAEQIKSEGPQIIQAGQTNYASTSLKEGFKHHPAAWGDHEVRFFVHELAGK